MKGISIIFPITGGEIFTKEGDKTCIEKKVDPFLKWVKSFKYFSGYFVFYSGYVSMDGRNELDRMFEWKFSDTFSILGLVEKTKNVCEMNIGLLEFLDCKDMKNIIICDCNRPINPDPIFEYLLNNKTPDCIAPVIGVNNIECGFFKDFKKEYFEKSKCITDVIKCYEKGGKEVKTIKVELI